MDLGVAGSNPVGRPIFERLTRRESSDDVKSPDGTGHARGWVKDCPSGAPFLPISTRDTIIVWPPSLPMPPKLKHELRTPLNHILGYSEMLLEEAPGREIGDWHRGLERIHELGEILQRGVDELTPAPAGSQGPRTPPEWPALIGEIQARTHHLASLVPADAAEQGVDLARIRSAADTFGRLIANLNPPEAVSSRGLGRTRPRARVRGGKRANGFRRGGRRPRRRRRTHPRGRR